VSQARTLGGALPLCLRTLAIAGALTAALAASPADGRAQAPADATLCPPPPRRLSFAISPVAATGTPARRKSAARPKPAAAALTARRTRPVVGPRRAAGALPAPVVARRKKRTVRPRSVVPMPKVVKGSSLARSTGVCQPWTHELAAPLVGMVASAAVPTARVPLVGAVGSPFPPPVFTDDGSSFGGWWWMLPVGGVAIAGATAGGSGGEGAGVAGVEVGRGGSGTPVVTAPADVPPIVVGAPEAPPTDDGTVPAVGTGMPGATPGQPVFPTLPPVPPVGSTSPPGSSAFTPPDGTFGFTPDTKPDDAPPVGGPGGSGPGGDGPGGAGPDVPGIEDRPPQLATAVVPEPSALSLVLVGGGLLTLVAWGTVRRS
jgi:hypothetical protein